MNIQSVTNHPLAISCVIIFIISYIFVTTEEFTELNKSKPVVLCAGLIWALIGIILLSEPQQHPLLLNAINFNLTEYIDLFMFLVVTIVYVNALEDQHLFVWIRNQLTQYGFSYHKCFWLTGAIAFILSSVLNNLTTAMLLYAVIMAIGKDQPKFLAISAIHIVVASNAGGVFDPFGDITTLMVWQHGILGFISFLKLGIPAIVSYIIPAVFMSFAIPKGKPEKMGASVHLKKGTPIIIFLFALTLLTAVIFRQYLDLLPSLGMTTGLGYLWLYDVIHASKNKLSDVRVRKIFSEQWDTLLFFYGVMVSVGGLATLGYLQLLSNLIYPENHSIGPYTATTIANTAVGIISALVDNIPIMFAILTMKPDMSNGQWLLVTLTSGIGGSLLAVGSAAGVALLGQSKGAYTFMKHLRWMPIILLGYVAAVMTHLIINRGLF